MNRILLILFRIALHYKPCKQIQFLQAESYYFKESLKLKHTTSGTGSLNYHILTKYQMFHLQIDFDWLRSTFCVVYSDACNFSYFSNLFLDHSQ